MQNKQDIIKKLQKISGITIASNIDNSNIETKINYHDNIEKQNNVIIDPVYKKAMDTAVRLLAIRNHTKYEIIQKLKKNNFSQSIIAKVIDRCESLNYLDDELCAKLYYKELYKKGYGSYRIIASMKQKGIQDSVIENVMEEYGLKFDELENARKVFLKKLKTIKEDSPIKVKEKIYRFLYSRGFPHHIISMIFEKNDNL